MLKKFFWNLLSSFVGAWIALLGFGVLMFFVIVGLIARIGISSASDEMKIEKHSILKISLSGTIDEREKKMDMNYISLAQGNVEKTQSLSTLVAAIGEAKENKDVDAIYLDCGGVSAGFATLDALRKSLVDFKTSGKKIYAYGTSYSTPDYFVASCADSIFLNSEGSMALQGISGSIPYMKGLFDKLGVNFQVVKVGTFKSAVEPYTMTEMSAPAKAQLDTLYGNMWSYLKKAIADSRQIQSGDIDRLINTDHIMFAPQTVAVKGKLVDKLISHRMIDESLGRLVGKDPDKVNFISPAFLASRTKWGKAYGNKNQIAVLYATGEISETGNDGINCFNLVPVIVKLADDDNVKGLVLRVNSPGGSVFGSAEIAEALQYFKSKKKPFAVSMGDYAASGGYWISADAERIFADPLTITGSIGIYGLLPELSGAAEKLGVNMQSVSTNPEAAFPSLFRPMNEQQYSVMQNYINRGYDRFVKRVSKGRKLPEAKVRAIAEGRVWDAMTARKLGLVDDLGSLDDAVKWTAKKAKIEDNYDVAAYPEMENSFWDLLPDASSAAIYEAIERQLSPGVDARTASHLVNVLRGNPMQARMIPIDLAKWN